MIKTPLLERQETQRGIRPEEENAPKFNGPLILIQFMGEEPFLCTITTKELYPEEKIYPPNSDLAQRIRHMQPGEISILYNQDGTYRYFKFWGSVDLSTP